MRGFCWRAVRRLPKMDFFENLLQRFALDRLAVGEHGIQGGAEAVDISGRAERIVFTVGLFGTPVVGRTDG